MLTSLMARMRPKQLRLKAAASCWASTCRHSPSWYQDLSNLGSTNRPCVTEQHRARSWLRLRRLGHNA
jgi:hypothetical protein